ncbi:hypothetical protein vBBaMIFTN7_56 [Bordetella phage vB_BaM-IFTN7]|nr:hypothetical protein vBBaMIFTN1_52 [Bordetella phage vB_BaM-IFTN1]UOK17181.1 hypothetical protein vBBaMIFTN3_52 [Bordetella phage vB_BaM-IFTN3]UOK17453.1 hypothetical protein vBBaMIFTN7_56 [Bordetella phage vB_BaM-IFTN7]UOK17593.1 hypothetical protein vBBaMIFTN9_52 [Bordetella phage vB_BaM-IFTN9]
MVNDLTFTGLNFSLKASSFRAGLSLWKHDHIRLGLATQSMQRSAHMFRLVVGGAFTFRAQLAEQIHYCTFGRINKAALCHVGSGVKQFFGFGHVGTPELDASSLNGAAFSGIHFHFKGVEAA